MIVVLIIMGGWFGYDGYKGWPEENAKIADLTQQLDVAKRAKNEDEVTRLNAIELTRKAPHSDMDIFFQKLLAFTLPAGALALLAWTLRRSRGEYRLSGQTLRAPGHPAIELSDIIKLDDALWDRKGIAWLQYQKPDGTRGNILLDDFIYARDPIDEIHKRAGDALGIATMEPTPERSA
jgi:hypothetical protein